MRLSPLAQRAFGLAMSQTTLGDTEMASRAEPRLEGDSSCPEGLSIALVGPLPPPYGGMANQTRQLAELLRSEGCAVEVVRYNAPYRPAWISGVVVVRAIFRLIPYLVGLWRVCGRVSIVHIMANSGWAWHLFAAPAIWIAWLRGRPVNINYRGGGAERFFGRAWWIVGPTVGRASVVTVPSGFLQAIFAERGVQTAIVPNIIDLSRFRPNGRWTSGERRSEPWPHVVVTRNLETIYDIGTALRSFRTILEHCPRARMTVAGTGPEEAGLRALARDLDVAGATNFVGRLDNQAIAELYQQADLMLNPSRVDNMPISILEALASGVPVVSTDAGGIAYVVQDGVSASLVAPGDDAAMAERAMRILGDPELAQDLVREGVRVLARYEWASVRKRLFSLYIHLAMVESGRS